MKSDIFSGLQVKSTIFSGSQVKVQCAADQGLPVVHEGYPGNHHHEYQESERVVMETNSGYSRGEDEYEGEGVTAMVE